MDVPKRFIQAVFCFLLLAALSQAQSPPPTTETTEPTAETTVETVVTTFVNAFNAGDEATLAALYAPADGFPFVSALGEVFIAPGSVNVTETASGSALVRFDYLEAASGARTPGTFTLERLQDGRVVVWELGPELAAFTAAPATPAAGGWSSLNPWLRRLLILLGVPILLSVLFLLFAFLYGMVRGTFTPPHDSPSPQLRYEDRRGFGPSVLNWLLSVVAVYKVMWANVVDKLVDDENVMGSFDKREMLQNDWDIYNRQDLLSALMDLYHEGHRPFVKALQRENPLYPQADPLAWDLARYLMLCAVGASIRYIEAEEAQVLMLPAGRQLRACYGSWGEMADGFVAGRTVWLAKQGEGEKGEMERLMAETLELLKKSPKSPWAVVPWDLPLPEAASENFFTRVSDSYLSYRDAYLEEQRSAAPAERTTN